MFEGNARTPSWLMQVFALKGSKGEAGPTVAGCRVSDGTLRADMRYRIVRDGEVRASLLSHSQTPLPRSPSRPFHTHPVANLLDLPIYHRQEMHTGSLKISRQYGHTPDDRAHVRAYDIIMNGFQLNTIGQACLSRQLAS